MIKPGLNVNEFKIITDNMYIFFLNFRPKTDFGLIYNEKVKGNDLIKYVAYIDTIRRLLV